MTCVSASDNQIDLVAQDSDSVNEEILTDENLKTEFSEESIDDTISTIDDDESGTVENDLKETDMDKGKYSELAEQINLGNYDIPRMYYKYDLGDTINITDHNIVINGNGATIDMAGSSIRALTVIGSEVTIKNLTIINANYDGKGGAIYFEKDGKITDCVFYNNNANVEKMNNYEFLGTVYFNKYGIMENCNFTANNAYTGGAAYFKDEGEVKNCIFVNNNATESAGIFMGSGELINCSFDNNYAPFGLASAIYSRSTTSFKNCNFTNNIALYKAVYLGKDTGTFENCNFINNQAVSGGLGGAIRLDYGNFTNCTFVGNSAIDGGAVHIKDGIFKNCNFENNTASETGGAIHGNSLTIENCNFTNNEATKGGAILAINPTIIKQSKFSYNKAESGGAIFAYDSLNIEDSQFEGNEASDGTNNIHFGRDEGLSIKNCTPEYLGPYWEVYLSSPTAPDVVYGNDVEVTVEASTEKETTAKNTLGADVTSLQNYMSSNNNALLQNYVPILKGSVFVYIFNGGMYFGTISNGTAKIKIPGLNAGTYWGLVVYDGGMNYTKPTELVTFKVLKQNATIAAGDEAYLINYGGKYAITLKDADGKAIIGVNLVFKLDGKNIGSSTTNAEGIATIKLTAKDLKAVKSGKKKLVIGFDDNNYNPVSISVKITVKKEKTKLAAKNKKFKKSEKTKKYTIALKNSKGKAVKKVKVSLKIKGKTYTAKTNAKGKAVFKIKKLNKKGTYKANVTFKGNAYYNKASKKVKIEIK